MHFGFTKDICWMRVMFLSSNLWWGTTSQRLEVYSLERKKRKQAAHKDGLLGPAMGISWLENILCWVWTTPNGSNILFCLGKLIHWNQTQVKVMLEMHLASGLRGIVSILESSHSEYSSESSHSFIRDRNHVQPSFLGRRDLKIKLITCENTDTLIPSCSKECKGNL